LICCIFAGAPTSLLVFFGALFGVSLSASLGGKTFEQLLSIMLEMYKGMDYFERTVSWIYNPLILLLVFIHLKLWSCCHPVSVIEFLFSFRKFLGRILLLNLEQILHVVFKAVPSGLLFLYSLEQVLVKLSLIRRFFKVFMFRQSSMLVSQLYNKSPFIFSKSLKHLR